MRQMLHNKNRLEQPAVAVLEDDQATAIIYRLCLEDEGYSTNIFTDNDDCRKFLRKESIDLLILDVVMPPEENGLEFLASLYEEFGDKLPQVIVATGLSQSTVKHHRIWQQIKTLRTLFKPFDLDEMMEAVHRLVPPPNGKRRPRFF
jgi:DNA-binding NtrC family response regulator